MNKIYRLKIIRPEFDDISNQYGECNNGAGGDGGSIEIYTRKIIGTGSIVANGGDGSIGGRGGKVKLVTEDATEFNGQISAQGGNSHFNSIEKKNEFFEPKQPETIGYIYWFVLFPINVYKKIARHIDNKLVKFLFGLIIPVLYLAGFAMIIIFFIFYKILLN